MNDTEKSQRTSSTGAAPTRGRRGLVALEAIRAGLCLLLEGSYFLWIIGAVGFAIREFGIWPYLPLCGFIIRLTKWPTAWVTWGVAIFLSAAGFALAVWLLDRNQPEQPDEVHRGRRIGDRESAIRELREKSRNR